MSAPNGSRVKTLLARLSSRQLSKLIPASNVYPSRVVEHCHASHASKCGSSFLSLCRSALLQSRPVLGFCPRDLLECLHSRIKLTSSFQLCLRAPSHDRNHRRTSMQYTSSLQAAFLPRSPTRWVMFVAVLCTARSPRNRRFLNALAVPLFLLAA